MVIAAAAVKLEHCEGTIQVQMPGGTLDVTVGRDYSLILRGPVEYVGVMQYRLTRTARLPPQRAPWALRGTCICGRRTIDTHRLEAPSMKGTGIPALF